jgi:hypothetical protein
MNKHRRLSRASYLRLSLPRLLTFVVAVGLLSVFGWYTNTGGERNAARCLRAYAKAATLADTAEVDRLWLGGRRPDRGTFCGDLRRDGTLGRARSATRVAA